MDTALRRRSCSTNKLARDDDSKKCHCGLSSRRSAYQTVGDRRRTFKSGARAERGHRRPAASDQGAPGSARAFDRDGLDASNQFVDRYRTAPCHHLPRQLLGTRAGALQRHQQAGFHLRLRARHLGLVDGFRRGADLAHHDAHQLGDVGGVGARVEPEHSRVRIGGVERIDRIAEAALLAHFLEQPGRHAAAEHIGEHLQAVQAGVPLRQALHRERDMYLLEVAAFDLRPADEMRGLRGRRCLACERRKLALDIRHHRLVVDRTGGRDHHVRCAVVARKIVGEPGAVESANRRRRAENRAPDRLVGIGGLLQTVPDQVIRGILGSPDLLHDDVLLALELGLVERGIRKDVGQHVERKRHVGAQHARIVGRGLDRGGRIEIAAHRFDLLRDLARATPRGSLERHVLEEMRNAVLVRPFVPASDADPDAERSGLQMRHRVRHHDETRGKARDLDTHAAAPSCAARLVERMWRSIVV